MKVYHNFNDVSQELLDTVPKLKPGQKITFQMLTGINIQDAETGENKLTYGKMQIPCRDRIKDPFTGKVHDIGIVEEYDIQSKEPTKFRFFMPGWGDQHFRGTFELVGGIVEDEELLEYLWLSNLNDSNPNRSDRMHSMFRPIDVVADSKKIKSAANKRRDALILVTEMDLRSMKSVASALNFPDFQDDEVLRGKVIEWADENPDDFLELYANPATMIKADIRRAIDKSILVYDPAGNRMLWAKGNAIIATFDRVEGVDHLQQMADWCQTAKNGAEVLKTVRKKLKESILEPEEAPAE